MFTGEHGLDLFRRHSGNHAVNPVGQALFYDQCLPVAAEPEGVAQAGHGLVDIVKRCPKAVQVKRLCLDIPGSDLFPQDALPVGDGGYIPRSVHVLAFGEFLHDIADLLQKADVATGLVHVGAGAQVMPQGMPGNRFVLPAMVMLCLWGQTGLFAELGQQTVGLIGQYALHVQFHSAQVRTGQELNVFEVERHGFEIDFFRAGTGNGEHGLRAGTAAESACQGQEGNHF